MSNATCEIHMAANMHSYQIHLHPILSKQDIPQADKLQKGGLVHDPATRDEEAEVMNWTTYLLLCTEPQ